MCIEIKGGISFPFPELAGAPTEKGEIVVHKDGKWDFNFVRGTEAVMAFIVKEGAGWKVLEVFQGTYLKQNLAMTRLFAEKIKSYMYQQGEEYEKDINI